MSLQRVAPRRKSSIWSLAILLLSAVVELHVQPEAQAQARESAGRLLERMGVTRGICVVLGDPDGKLAMEVARASDLLVYTQLESAAAVEKARSAAEAAGMDSSRFQVDQGAPGRLHLADNIADALVAAGGPAGVSEEEALRVLRPRAKAILGEREIIKPAPEGADDWSHNYHGPDNNTLSLDRIIRPPYLTQFLADPRYGPAPQAAVASAGRVFKAFGHVAWHEREEAYLSTLVAFGGYNGTILWKRKLPEGIMVHRSTLVATPEILYLGDDKSCKLLDAATGELKDEIVPPVELAGGTFWKWMALEGGVLYALVGEEEQKDPDARWKRTEHGWPWDQISKGYNQPENPWGFGRNLFAIDPGTKKVLWHHRESEPIDSRALCTKGGRIFAFRFGAYLTCIDAKSGQVLWRKTRENAPDLFEILGTQLPRQGWQTNWRTVAYAKCSDRAIYFAGPQVKALLAVSADDGRILWQHPHDNFQTVLHEDGLYGISGGVWGDNVSKKFDPLTGKILADLDIGRRACTRPTATLDSIFFRAMGGSVRFDLKSGRPRWISPMRPPCQDGVTVANGLLYWWPYACDCQLTLYGVTCLGPAGDFNFTPEKILPDRLEKPGGGPVPAADLPESPADWPTFRANNQGTATSLAAIPETAGILWEAKAASAPGPRPTAPVAAGGLAFLAGSDGAVRALDAATGREKWKARTGGEIRFPPTIWKGRALVGSGDGWVYAYEAASGRLLWRFRAAPVERRIPVYGKLLSTWPASSGVLVQDGTAYVAAGLANYDGTYVYALDAATGGARWVNDTSGHLDPEARTGVGVQGHMLLSRGRLYLAGGNAVSPAEYDLQDGKCLNDPAPLEKCESTSPRGSELYLVGDRVIACGHPFYAHPDIPVYDHTVVKKLFHASAGGVHAGGVDIVWLDSSKLMAFKPLDKVALSRCVTDERVPQHIIQAWGKFKTVEKPLWERGCPGSLAVAVAKNAVIVATAGEVVAISLQDGRELWKQPLLASPVPWGLAVDPAGRVILSLVDGRVVALGS